MKESDISITLNGEELSQWKSLASNMDLSFFEHISSHFNGRHTIRFYVGDTQIESDVRMTSFKIAIKNNFFPYDIDAFVNQEKSRVQSEQEAANFHDRPTEIFYIDGSVLLDGVHTVQGASNS